jgi:hypothetical protein
MATAPAPSVPIKKHSAALFPLWFYLTLGIYWLFWLHRTYKDIHAHAPGATTITPGKAVGFLFIPFFNIYWFFRIAIDFPRAIARMQKWCHPQEERLPAGAISTMLAMGLVLSALGANVHPAAWIAGQILVVTAFVSCQQAMNAHSENHARALRGQPIVAARGERSFAQLIGTRGATIEWTRVAIFAVSLAVINPAFILVNNLFAWRPPYFHPYLSLYVLLANSLAMTAVAVLAFRYIKDEPRLNYWCAALLAGIIWAPLMLLARKAVESRVPGLHVGFVEGLFGAVDAFLTLALLALCVQVARSAWVGLGLGFASGWMASYTLFALRDLPRTWYDSVRSLEHLIFDVTDIGAALVCCAIFALVFWLLTKLLVRPAEARALP